MAEITLSRQQQLAWELLNDPRVVELLYGGAAGGGKSLLIGLWSVIQCRMFPGIRIGLGRNEISNLRKTTGQTLLAEVHPMLGVTDADFRYSSMVDPGIYYKNGSQILFIDLAPAPRDPNFDRLGSLNLTHNIIEEAGEVQLQARSVFTSRKNRYLNKKYGITGKTILTCNPSENFTREQFYDPYEKLGAGDAQVWPHGQVSIDDDSKLFKPYLFKRTDTAEGDDYAGCDPSSGGDRCTFAHIKGNVVVHQQALVIPKDDPKLDIGTFVAENFIAYCQEREIGYDRAAVDVVGIGASVLDACNRLGFYVQAFNAGSTKGVRQLDRHGQVIDNPHKSGDGVALFNNIRSQTYYDMAGAAHKGELLFLEDLPHFDDLKKDLAAHKYEVKERQVIVESKDKLKVRLGKSPDFSDAVMSAWWCRNSGGANMPRLTFL